MMKSSFNYSNTILKLSKSKPNPIWRNSKDGKQDNQKNKERKMLFVYKLIKKGCYWIKNKEKKFWRIRWPKRRNN